MVLRRRLILTHTLTRRGMDCSLSGPGLRWAQRGEVLGAAAIGTVEET
jgi:hypothetical protein